jgi:hypothetical protein
LEDLVNIHNSNSDDMRTLSFAWAEDAPLASEVAKPLTGISVIFFHAAWGPYHLTLWRKDGTGLRLSSEMHDVAIRSEVGVLRFEPVSAPLTGEVFADLPPAFHRSVDASKLTIREANAVAESGISIIASDGSEIVVVASAGPCCLAVLGALTSLPHIFEPEYPMEQYVRTTFR